MFKELEKNSEFDSHMYTYFQKIKTNFGSFFLESTEFKANLAFDLIWSDCIRSDFIVKKKKGRIFCLLKEISLL